MSGPYSKAGYNYAAGVLSRGDLSADELEKTMEDNIDQDSYNEGVRQALRDWRDDCSLLGGVQSMSDDKMAAANQITSADVSEHAKLLAKLTDIRRQKDALFGSLAIALGDHLIAGQHLRLTLVNMPDVCKKLERLYEETHALHTQASALMHAELDAMKA